MWAEENEGEDMRKVVVFDSGWGGEVVANYLAQELSVAEIVRVINWGRRIYAGNELDVGAVAECLEPYIGKVDLIILGGYGVGTVLPLLERGYPEQAFVAPSVNYEKILNVRQYPERVAILMNATVRKSALLQEIRTKLPYSTLILPECMHWEELIDNNMMTEAVVRAELAWDFEVQEDWRERTNISKKQSVEFSPLDVLAESSPEKQALMRAIRSFGQAAEQASREEKATAVAVEQLRKESSAGFKERMRIKPDLVLLLNTHFWDIKPEIERILGWRVRVLDFREKLLHDVCVALKLRGVDGKRPK